MSDKDDMDAAPGADPETAINDDDAPEMAAALDYEAQINTLNDQLLRLAAELENTRRRAERDKGDASRYAIAAFARDLLGVADNFERALHAAGDNSAPAASDAVTGLLAGLRMTEKELLTTLDRHGVRRIDAEGEKFDPNLHQAVAQVPHPTIEAGRVVDIAQPGYTIGDRVLRAAMVTVSSGASDAAGSNIDTKA